MSSEEQTLTLEAVTQIESSKPVRTPDLLASRLISVALWLGVVCLSVWLTGLLLSWATRSFDFTEPKLSEGLQFQGQQFDILYLGDSLTLEGVNAEAVDRSLGTRSYNMALGGASILESEIQLRHFLAHNPKPRLIALGLYINQQNRPVGVRPSLYFGLSAQLRATYEAELGRLENAKVGRSFIAFNLIPAYRYRNTIDLLLKAVLSPQRQRPTFVQGQARVSFSRPINLGRSHDSTLSLAELQSFLTLCKEQQLPVFLFEPPNSEGYSALTHNRGVLLSAIHGMENREANVTFDSFGETGFNYQPGEWVNLNHLNLAGSEKFGTVLAGTLGQFLPPKTR